MMTEDEARQYFIRGFLGEHPIFGDRYANGLFDDFIQGVDRTNRTAYQEGYDVGLRDGYSEAQYEYDR